MIAGILIGGSSTRMGRPKALIEINGVTLVERTIEVARSACETVVLLGRPGYELPPAARCLTLLPDAVADRGPIGGLESLLEHAREPCVMLACDMPGLTGELLSRLAEGPSSFDAAVPRTGGPPGQWHPCCALYRPSALSVVRERMEKGRFAMMGLVSALRVFAVELIGDEAHWVRNWNAPDDVRIAEAGPD